MYQFRFIPDENKSSHSINRLLKVSSAPLIPFPEEIVETVSLGDGTEQVYHTGKYKDITIEIPCNFIQISKRAYADNISMIREYFGNRQGLLEMTSDYPDHYFIVKNVELVSNERKIGIIGDITIRLTCDPYRYIKKYQNAIHVTTGNSISLSNSFADASPLYRIYNQSSEAETLTIKSGTNRFIVHDPFSPVLIGDGMDDWSIEYIEIDTENELLKRVGKNADFTSGYRITYDTIKTEGSFDTIRIPNGQKELSFSIDKGAVTFDIFRNYREL